MTENGFYCPDCGEPMTKAGGTWSGRRRVQQYRCTTRHGCGRATIRPLDGNGNRLEAKPYIKEVVSK